MVVHILEKGRIDSSKIGQVKSRVEVDRGAGQIGIARLDVDFGRVAQLGDKPPVHRPCFLVIHNLAVAEEAVAVEAVGGAVGTGQHQAGALADRHRNIARRLVRSVFGRAGLDAAFQNIARFQRLDDDRPCGGVAAIERTLRPFQYFDLAQGALILVELGGIGLENAVDHQRHRAFGIARAVDAADIDLGVARFRGAADDGDAGGQLDKLVGLLDAGAVQHVFGEHGDRCRDVGEQFILPPGGDDDDAGIRTVAGFLFAAGLGLCGVETGQRGKADRK